MDNYSVEDAMMNVMKVDASVARQGVFSLDIVGNIYRGPSGRTVGLTKKEKNLN